MAASSRSLRSAVEDDLDEICALIHELAAFERLEHEVVLDRDAVRDHLFGPTPAAYVTIAEVDGSVAGFALWFTTFSTFLGRPGIWLEDLFVRPEHRGAGVGRDLLAHLQSISPGRVEWAVLDWNTEAQAFYRTMGAAPQDEWTTWRWTGDRA
jgi:GNAT superfamily N-acetyltransferase